MSYVIEQSLNAAPVRRPRLITPAGLIVVAVTVAVSLAVLFPGLDFGHPKFLAHPDELAIAYLNQLLRQRPEDRSARLLLARQELALGKWTEAEANLQRLAGGDDAIAWRARLALAELERSMVDALPAGEPARAARQVKAVAALGRLTTAPLEAAELTRAADVALALESPGDAAVIYDRLARQQPAGEISAKRHWARLAGRWYRAAGRLQESATAYLFASASKDDAGEGASDAVAAIDVLRAANDGRKALDVAEGAIARWPSDSRLLDRGIALALSESDLHHAQSWGARRLALASGDDAIRERQIQQQIEIDLGAGDPPAALALLLELADRHPNDPSIRERVAEVAGWSGQPRVALAAWIWLAGHGSAGARDKAIELGRALFDHQTVIALLEAAGRSRELKLAEVLDLADALESEGNPEGARAALRRFEPLFANQAEYWTQRAVLDEHVGDLDGALFSVREVNRRFAGFAEPAREPELLWSLDRPEEALAAARHQAATDAPKAASFWRLYGDLAWSQEADSDAENAYQHVWAAGAADAEVAERLAPLLAAGGRIDELARVAADAFQRLGASSVLLTAMDAAVESERWAVVQELASLGAARPAPLEDEPEYWSVLGRLAVHDGHPAEAAAALTKAVALAPSDTGLAEDLHSARVEAGLESEPESADDARAAAKEAASGRLSAAIDRHDRGAVRHILATDGDLLTLSERVDAEREIGRDDVAWALLAHAPLHSGDSDEDASLALHRQELAEDRLSGAFAGGGYENLSALAMFGQWGRVAVRSGQLSMEALVGHDRLDSSTGPVVGPIHADEAKAGLGLTLQEPMGDTRIEAGAYGFGSRAVPYASAVQRLEPLHGLTVDLEGLYHQRPTDTAALRAAALKDSAELEVAWRFADRYQVVGAAGATHYGDRDGGLLASGGIGRLELSRLLREAAPLIRLRADGFVEANRLAAVIPAGVAAVVPVGTPIADVVPETYGTAGLGLTLLGLGDSEDDLVSGRAAGSCRRCLRPFVDLWAGWLMPAERLTYSLDAGLGYLFAHHQELGASGFYRSDQGGQVGQRYMGVSLLYALRWL